VSGSTQLGHLALIKAPSRVIMRGHYCELGSRDRGEKWRARELSVSPITRRPREKSSAPSPRDSRISDWIVNASRPVLRVLVTFRFLLTTPKWDMLLIRRYNGGTEEGGGG